MTTGSTLADAIQLERALAASRYYPLRHMAPLPTVGGNSWQNDGQNFVFDPYEGLWRTWALGLPEWRAGGGFPQTHWIEYAGPSLDQMTPLGIRIDRNTCPANSYWSGSVFVDWHNKLGRGYGSAWYYVSSPVENGRQAIMLLTAPRLGVTPAQQGIVIHNDAVPPAYRNAGRDFRDCRVIWDDQHDQLVLAATCGESFIFFASQDGLSWSFLSTMAGPGPLVECPNLLLLPVRDSGGVLTGGRRWAVLGAVQGFYTGSSDSYECCAVWVGDWNGRTFTPDAGYPLPIDYGPDSYATTTGTDHLGHPVVGYWLGNWTYCASYMPFGGFQNVQGLPRQCWLQKDHSGRLRLFSMPLESDRQAYADQITGSRQTIGGTAGDYRWQDGALPTGKCFRLDVVLEQLGGAWPGQTIIKLRTGTVKGGYYHTDLIIDGKTGVVTLDRSGAGMEGPGSGAPGAPGNVPDAWTKPYTLPATMGITSGNRITLSVLMDSCSLEAFFNEGLGSMAALIFPPDTCQSLTLAATAPVSAITTISHY